jgi:hypothetical protein
MEGVLYMNLGVLYMNFEKKLTVKNVARINLVEMKKTVWCSDARAHRGWFLDRLSDERTVGTTETGNTRRRAELAGA